MVAIEDLAIIFGFGYDINISESPDFICAIEFISIQKGNGSGSDFSIGKGKTIYESIENYKVKQSKPYEYGSELIYIISEDRARYGVEDVVLDLFRYYGVNTNAKVVICKGKCEDYFDMELKSESASETLSKLVGFANDEYFYSSKNTVNDLILMYFQKGREIYLPYIELKEGKPELTGAALFIDKKMVKKADINETKLINLFRSSNNKGIISVRTDNPHKYLEMEAQNKRKVKVILENNIINYIVNVDITGTLTMDTIYREELKKDQIDKIEKVFAASLKSELESVVYTVQNDYRVDCLDLTKYALAKYGRNSGYDSDEHFDKANISVNVNVKIDSIGRIYGSTKK